MVEAEHGVDYESHQTCDRENGLIKVKEEKDPVLLALLEWDTDEEEEEEQEEEEEEVSHVFIQAIILILMFVML
jgi:hypothetical protein